MAVSAAELPAMSSLPGNAQEVAVDLRQRLDAGLQRVAFFVILSAVAFLALGDVIISAVYQSGRFTHADAIYVWGILAGAAVGLLASTLGRLCASAYYALHDTRTPLYSAVMRILVGSGLGYLCAIPLPPMVGIEARWGVAGLTLASGLASWVELTLLHHTLNRHIGHTGLLWPVVAKLWGAAIVSAAVAWIVKLILNPQYPIVMAIAVLGLYGVVYFGVTYGCGVAEAKVVVGRLLQLSWQATA
jgi:putative peptidoglycan lipid II flippase